MLETICWWLCIISAVLLILSWKKIFWIPLIASLLFHIRETCHIEGFGYDYGYDFTQSGKLILIILAILIGGFFIQYFILKKLKDSDEEKEREQKATIGFAKLTLYNDAVELSKSNSYKDIETAIEKFSLLDGWKDSNQQIELLRKKLDEMKLE